MSDGREFDACAVCGRTILRGERVAEYMTQDGSPAGVCALCKTAAEDAGWVPAALAGALGDASSRRRRSFGFRQRLAKVSSAARGLTTRPERESEDHGPAEPPPSRPDHDGAPEQERSEERPRRPRRPERSRPTAANRHSEREPATKSRPKRRPTGERLLRTAIEIFNRSRERRKVAGLIRSLGEPQVALRPGGGGVVVVTVAWELSWYQWEVRTGDGAAIRESSKGTEVDQLAEHDRKWNATVSDDGALALESRAQRRAAQESE